MPSPTTATIVYSARAGERLRAAREFLGALAADAEAIVIAASADAANDLVRTLGAARGALFGLHRLTLPRLAGLLAAERIAAAGLAPAAALAAEAIAARAVYRLRPSGRLAYFGAVIDRPGFPGALVRTVGELRLGGVTPAEVARLPAIGPPLAALLDQYADELAAARLADRTVMLDAAIAALASAGEGNGAASRFSGRPIVILDVPIENARERDLIAALAARAPHTFATVPAGDEGTLARLGDALRLDLAAARRAPATDDDAPSLERLAEYLFRDAAPAERTIDASVTLISAAGEMQECVEIARRIQTAARGGVAFDRIAVALHAPARYAPYLEEALDRAGVPAHFARGAARPEPGGRALLALLACAGENLSARRFAEYLSLAQLPAAPPAAGADQIVAASDAEFAAGALRGDLATAAESEDLDEAPSPIVDPAARAPWRWEKLLVEAAVIGSRDRWARRLAGLAAELRLQRAELAAEDGAHLAAIDRQLIDLDHLRDAALPLIDALAALPRAAPWNDWLDHLRTLAGRAIRDREPILAALAELDPMGPVGPVTLDEVRIVLGDRLGQLNRTPARRRYGAVFVGPAAALRGLEFDLVIVPGLVERVFPRKLIEDPILADAARRALSPALATQADRVAAERLALRLAVGASCQRVVFSYPRVDLDQGRPRVPSFYALEILRAAEGRLPGFDELARRAAGEHPGRLGWPAPARPADAIDEAEFDLAVLDQLIDADPAATAGAAHYLLGANPHLGRALRARARRWLKRWTVNDGLVDPTADERAALARHQIAARTYSPTALQNFAACPYRFFLQAIHRLEPREEAAAIEVIDPLTRGSLVHEVQFELFTALRDAGRLPVTDATLAAAHATLDATLDAVATGYHDQLAPAIERVWLDGLDSIRADLREWLRRSAADAPRWRPDRFELGFGLAGRAHADPASAAAPATLDLAPGVAISLRGSIDLVERGAGGALRITDYKTGRARTAKDIVIGGGKTLQPVLYALAAEAVLGEPVSAGRLYYCTAAGGYEERVVALDDASRKAIAAFATTLDSALREGFLPAAPGARECEYCDYRRVCGPYEDTRVQYKTEGDNAAAKRLAGLRRLREMP
ncbi:MAG: PD-(D/E)XK nuclease family protein [Candidatus Binataceae bacterium]|nr:PD-(D/E)XK nuclease family protein [Candidatus Binataceae bacterium]